MKKITLSLSILLFIIIVLTIFVIDSPELNPPTYIVHASGEVSLSNGEKYTYTNTIDNFDNLYSKGYRYFEYDLMLSSDNHLIGIHDWEFLPGYSDDHRISYTEYVNTLILGELHGVTAELLIEKMIAHPDAHIVLDIKEKNCNEAYDVLSALIDATDTKLYSNFIPQLYSIEMWNDMKTTHNYRTYIYTNYISNYSPEQIINYFQDPKIKYISVWSDYLNNTKNKLRIKKYIHKLSKMNKELWTHTVNDVNDITKLSALGYKGIYTDNLTLFN